MKIVVVSDSHGNYPLIFKALDNAGTADAVIHLGDGEGDAEILADIINIDVFRVAGNCDHGSLAPRELLLELEGKRALLVHGHVYRVKEGLSRLEQRALEVEADVVLFGHTHTATVTTRSGILFVNPGSLLPTSSRQTGYAVLTLTRDTASADLFMLA